MLPHLLHLLHLHHLHHRPRQQPGPHLLLLLLLLVPGECARRRAARVGLLAPVEEGAGRHLLAAAVTTFNSRSRSLLVEPVTINTSSMDPLLR